jgi:hypothetical protein
VCACGSREHKHECEHKGECEIGVFHRSQKGLLIVGPMGRMGY